MDYTVRNNYALLHTQRFQFLHTFFPHWVNVDRTEGPIRCYLDQVGSFKAVWHNVIHVLIVVKHVFAVNKVSTILGIEGKMEERLIKIKMVMKWMVAMMPIWLSVICLPITIIV